MNINNSYTDLKAIRNTDIFYGKFTNNGSHSLCVNGLVTPKEFTLNSDVPDNFILTRVEYLISQNDVLDIKKFGNLNELVNGVKSTIDWDIILNSNADIMLFATDSSLHSVKITGVTSTIINGNWCPFDAFGNGLIANKNDLKITIRDDLSTLPFFEVWAVGIKL